MFGSAKLDCGGRSGIARMDNSSDVVLGLGPWSLVVLKDKFVVLGPGLGLAP